MHTNKRAARSFAIAVYLLATATRAHALSESVNISRAFDSATAVLVVRIESEQPLTEEGTQCGVRYKGSVIERFKGSYRANLDEVVFGRSAGLRINEEYLLFLNYISDPHVFYDEAGKRLKLPDEGSEEKAKTLTMIKCKGIVPGLAFDERAAWQVELDTVIVHGYRPIMPESIRALSPELRVYLINRGDLFSYLRSLHP